MQDSDTELDGAWKEDMITTVSECGGMAGTSAVGSQNVACSHLRRAAVFAVGPCRGKSYGQGKAGSDSWKSDLHVDTQSPAEETGPAGSCRGEGDRLGGDDVKEEGRSTTEGAPRSQWPCRGRLIGQEYTYVYDTQLSAAGVLVKSEKLSKYPYRIRNANYAAQNVATRLRERVRFQGRCCFPECGPNLPYLATGSTDILVCNNVSQFLQPSYN